jgi:hypothetical protein
MAMRRFVNRTQELSELERWWSKPGSALGVVWGRKRVGKSWLLDAFAKDKRAIQHVARTRPTELELGALSTAVGAVITWKRRSLADRPFRDWDDVFDSLADAAQEQPLLFILDEFPELLRVEKEYESALRAIWARIEGTGSLKVLVCGSAVRTMEALQANDAALFGRATLRLLVQPFQPHEAALMLPEATPQERAAAWGVCGGTPRYLALWDDTEPFKENLRNLICNEQGILLSEGELVLADEEVTGSRGQHIPEQVLRTIGSGRTSYSEIEAALGTNPARGLDQLERLQLIEKVKPVTDRSERPKLTYYRIADNFLAFWIRCVEPRRSQIERRLGATVVNIMAAEFDDFMGLRYEEAFRSHLRRLAQAGQFGADVVDVGEWWREQRRPEDDPCQLDAVMLAGRRAQPVAIGEAKWAKRVNGSSELGRMKRKLHDSKLADPDGMQFIVGARETVVRSQGVRVVTAADIFTP